MSKDKMPMMKKLVQDRIGKALNIKSSEMDQLRKSFEKDENDKELERFCEDGTMYNNALCVRVKAPATVDFFADKFIPMSELPKAVGKYYVAIRTKVEISLTEDNVNELIIFHELTRNVIENMEGVLKEVYLPILNNPSNQEGWSDLVSKDLMEKFHNFLAASQVTIGQIKGRTLLPLPPSDITTSERTSSKDKAHVLESAIITWTKQIKTVLKQDPEAGLKNDKEDPNPLAEIDFWKNKALNLNSIYKQLQSDKIKKVMKFLSQNKSTYTGPFSKLQKEVQNARIEANDNYKHLNTLYEKFTELTNGDIEFPEIQDLFTPIMHNILLIWTNSKFYNTPARLVVLIREICNSIITQAVKYIDGPAIFANIEAQETTEAVEKLGKIIDVCCKFKETYFVYKGKSDGTWSIQNNALFVRLDSFMERCQDILALTLTILQFSKLERIEIGGTKGTTLTISVEQIQKSFDEAVKTFTSVEQDIMKIQYKEFDKDFYEFRTKIKEQERRLGSILSQGFDDSDTIYGRFKLLDSFEGLLNRPIIQDELEKKHSILLESYKLDLKAVQAIFIETKPCVDRNDDTAPIPLNYPPIAGAIVWSRGLLERIEYPYEKLKQLHNQIQEKDEYKDVNRLYDSLQHSIKEQEKSKTSQWEKEIDVSGKDKLNQPLLRRTENKTLKVNFDPMIVRLLREVKYLLLMDIAIPANALEIYQKVDIYRNQTTKLDIIVDMYNTIVTTLNRVEEPMLREKINKMDDILQPGITDQNWRSSKIDEYINRCKLNVGEVSKVVNKMKSNLEEIQRFLADTATKPLLERKPKPSLPEEFQSMHSATFSSKLNAFTQKAKDISKLLKDTMDCIKIPKHSKLWKNYVDYVNGIIIEGLAGIIDSSMKYISNQISSENFKKGEVQPIFDISITLPEKDILFEPEMGECEMGTGLRNIIQSWLDDFYSVASSFSRIDSGIGDYLQEIKEHTRIKKSLATIMNCLITTEVKCEEQKQKFQAYEELWIDDIDEKFEEFINNKDLYKKEVINEDEDEEETEDMSNNPLMKGVAEKLPELHHFDERISTLIKKKEIIQDVQRMTQIDWLRVDASKLKTSIIYLLEKCIRSQTNYIKNNNLQKLENIKEFSTNIDEGLRQNPKDTPQNKELLMKVMKNIRDMIKYHDFVNKMFNPMKEQIVLLKKHGVAMEGDLIGDLDSARIKCKDIYEDVLTMKKDIKELKDNETINIKKNVAIFDKEVDEFRLDFLSNLPFNNIDFSESKILEAYTKIDEQYEKLTEQQERANHNNELERLFELQITKYKKLAYCIDDLLNLKTFYDTNAIVFYQYNLWKLTLWDKIDTDDLEFQNKELGVQIRNLSKPIKSWKSFGALNKKTEDMKIILPLISQLHSKNMKERHWIKLGQRINQKINFQSAGFKFDDIIALKLQNYQEIVEETVELANKEAKVETKLAKIESYWENAKLIFTLFKRTEGEEGTQLLDYVGLGDIIETLEGHQMDVMGMITGGKVEFFMETLEKWQSTLKCVDDVLSVWIKVQKNWQRLEPIFLKSEDIRSQLPDDTKRFEELDKTFKDILEASFDQPSVIESCLMEGRLDSLKQNHEIIETCEKSLNDYLEQKKKAFPRFYFVSNQTLLDILSNGTNPHKVAENIKDCFDGLNTIRFIEKQGKLTFSADQFISKEGEIVKMFKNFDAVGAVETWLSNLEKHMRETFRDHLEVSKIASDNWEVDKPRHVWLQDQCAQISLVGSQIVWTEEVNKAFEDLEGGSDNAMKLQLQLCEKRIQDLIKMVLEDLNPELRLKVITIITIDVHAKDVVDKFVQKKIADSQIFAWQSQLKFYWIEEGQEVGGPPSNKPDIKRTCRIKICDWTTDYSYEYVGNCGRLVITPLTDRCYITLTQACNLELGGAPAGPAGTGKTETTKDLGRALALPVYVFNCSDQMTYQSMAQIFMGLSQSGAWGCFDEFNRISIEVLSVVGTQVSTILDAIKDRKKRFLFFDEDLNLISTCNFFITMNPGQAGRTELPENVKSLFRSCAMVVPNLELICENMLMGEGFSKARRLAKRFVCLYSLSSQLLSKQMHQDWGLRAVKSVLRQAGGLKREDVTVDEDAVLMRALRDFNKPKITMDDRFIFLRLIEDLFPAIKADQKLDPVLEAAAKKVSKIRNEATNWAFQDEESFILKVVQMKEILDVRHCMFIIGEAGSAKTTIWTILIEALRELGQVTYFETLNPKAVSSDELFGYINKAGEWKDGVLSVIMRNQVRDLPPYTNKQKNKWTILDGDIDPEWIESLNTVMDDNKVLTLVSNERIPLTPEMRLIFEIANMKNATPATVSRGGVLFINLTDIGWRPYMESYIYSLKPEKANDQKEIKLIENATSVFQSFCLSNQWFIDLVVDFKYQYEKICPMQEMSLMHTITCILNALMDTKDYKDNMRTYSDEDQKLTLLALYLYATMWAFGGCLSEEKGYNFKNKFNVNFRGIANTLKLKFPEPGSCFDYYWNIQSKDWSEWGLKVEEQIHNPDELFAEITVPNIDTMRIGNLMEMHYKKSKAIMFIGATGTGKSAIMKSQLMNLKYEYQESFNFKPINFNSFTDSMALFKIIQGGVEKRTGKTFGPRANTKLIFFVDDFNMPFVDKYDTQSPIALVRQLMDYKLMNDRNSLDEKIFIQDCIFFGCMNPKSGSFFINPRLQRWFTTISLLAPDNEYLKKIFGQILESHLTKNGFGDQILKYMDKVVTVTCELFNKVTSNTQFSPTAKKFHYLFNLREISRIFEGLLLSDVKQYKGAPVKFIRLWMHETIRVFGDRLIEEADLATIQDLMNGLVKQFDEDQEAIAELPNIFTSFVITASGADKSYVPIKDVDQLSRYLNDALKTYNETNAVMNLVLFKDAMEHITRICRILDKPCGHALLIGVGGSGKQSLTKLASAILEIVVAQFLISGSQRMQELQLDLQELIKKAVVKPGNKTCFILTDTQIVNERFLIYVNDLISGGFIPDLYPKEELDGLIQNLRNEAKGAGYGDTIDELFKFFINKTKRQLHVCLAFSPVGAAFKIRCRKFPGVVNCTVMDWFHPWPHDACVEVAKDFLSNVTLKSEELLENLSITMADIHQSIGKYNDLFLQLERRHNYTTPKSQLELIEFYKQLLGEKRDSIEENIKRQEVGLSILSQTKFKVDGLKEDLDKNMIIVARESEETNKLIDKVELASAAAAIEMTEAMEVKKITEAAAEAADTLQKGANIELQAAKPALEAAEEAVRNLDKKAIQELKALNNPPAACVDVLKAVLILLKEKKNFDWKTAQSKMKDPQKFIDLIKDEDGKDFDDQTLKMIKPIMELDFFNYETMKTKSSAGANLANWVINIVRFNSIQVNVAPLMEKVEQATAEKKQKFIELEEVMKKVKDTEDKVAALNAELEGAKENKRKVEEVAEACQKKLEMAERLVNGLADENVRWTNSVEELKKNLDLVVGNALLAASFVSYIGPFNSKFRLKLWKDVWQKYIVDKKIPIVDGLDPLKELCNDADSAKWQNEGLPTDRISIENASIITKCGRWPLIIDPQLQGNKWIRGRVKDDLQVIQLSQDKWVRGLEKAIMMGATLMIENCPDDLDATLEPVLTKAIYKRGKNEYFIKIVGEEKEYDMNFKLFLQTKLTNPHYRPETAAQCTIINFIVTESGLEDQLLAMVVNREKPELEEKRSALVSKQNEYKIILSELEDELLKALSGADPETILDNIELVEQLESTKVTAKEIAKQTIEAQKTEIEINKSREGQRKVAEEGAMLQFLIIQLYAVDHMYQQSLDSFVNFFFKAMDRTETPGEDPQRVNDLTKTIRMVIFTWISRGLFVRHKLLFLSQLMFRLMQKGQLQEKYNQIKIDQLCMCPLIIDDSHFPPEWLPNKNWYAILKLCTIEGFESFSNSIEKEAPNRFKDWYNELEPEKAKLPLNWKSLDDTLDKLLVLRALRPDRITLALSDYIRISIPDGEKFADSDAGISFEEILKQSYDDSSTTSPLFFLLSPGTNPIAEVYKMGKMLGFERDKNIFDVSLGQGQDIIADAKLEIGHKDGAWIILQNIHLMPGWCRKLEKTLDRYALEGSNVNFRLFLTADPNPEIPISLLERSIKLTNESPSGLKANMKKAFASQKEEVDEKMETKVKCIYFGLCYFHSCLIERKKFGPKGFNMGYPFNIGDLRDSYRVLGNYMETAGPGKIPWDDLKYIFGEIMYGGHVVDDWDRRLVAAQLDVFMGDALLDEAEMFPYLDKDSKLSFRAPLPGTFEKYIEHIDTKIVSETPIAFGMHPNAEVGFRTDECNNLFEQLRDVMPKDASGGDDEEEGPKGGSMLDRAEEKVYWILDTLQIEEDSKDAGKKFDLEDIGSRLPDERTPYMNVFMQECEYMNALTQMIVITLLEVKLGIKGELSMSASMEDLLDCLLNEKIPAKWAKVGQDTQRSLGGWIPNLLERIGQLMTWTEDPTNVPKVTFLNKLFNPQSFLNAIKQITAQKTGQALNLLYIRTDVQKKFVEELDEKIKDGNGAFICGFKLEGARWDTPTGQIEESKPKEMHSIMPVILARAEMMVEGKEEKGVYTCPVYKTVQRGKSYVFPAILKTRYDPAKWVLAGVVAILDVEGVGDNNPVKKG